MISYRFKRRAFITAMGGGLGVKVMLRNMEVSAQGMNSPPRLLVSHWPVGIVAGQNNMLWTPTSGSVGGSPGLQPFADAGLGADMTVFRGVSTSNLNVSGGGSHEQGTVALVTGRAAGGSRANCCEGDDAFAAPGGSFEQILLRNVTSLQSPARGIQGYANSIADSRTDFAEKSTQTLSYSTNMENVQRYNNGGTAPQAIPLKPILSPMQQFTNIFGTVMTGQGGRGGGGGGMGGGGAGGGAAGRGGAGGTGGGAAGRGGAGGGGGSGPNIDFDNLKRLACRRSVLDFAMEELNQLRMLGPADARNKLQIHYEEVVGAEQSVRNSINTMYPGMMTGAGGNMGTGMAGNSGGAGRGGSGGSTGRGGSGGSTGAAGTTGTGGSNGGPTCTTGCTSQPAAPPAVVGSSDGCADTAMDGTCRGTGNDYGMGNDAGTVDDSTMHQMVGGAHLDVLKAAFVCDLIRVGTFQWSPGTNHVGFRVYPGSTGIFQHHPLSHRIQTDATVGATTPAALNDNAEFLYNVQLWYFARHAENWAKWKSSVDGCGNPLLDFTIIPIVTEVRATGHERNDMPAMIVGGRRLGFAHNLYRTGNFSINSFWGTIAAKLGYTSTAAPFAAPIANL